MSNASKAIAASRDRPCPLLISHLSTEIPAIPHLKKALEDTNIETKIEAMKKVILLMLSGEPATQLIMTIIRFVLPNKDRVLKKLLLLYWEIVEKKGTNGKLMSEMYLVCNALMKDLTHPNEYIRGSTLRLIGKLKEPELVEPLVESVKINLQQRHAYVRRNAVLAIYSIYKDMPQLIPDAGDIIRSYMEKESDSSCKRNAFLMMFNTHPDQALDYLMSVMDQVSSFGEVLQLIVLEMIRRVSRIGSSSSQNPQQPSNKSSLLTSSLASRRIAFIRVIFTLLSSSVKSQSVQYEAAVTLLSLSRAPTAIKAASQALINILSQSSDNNVKMVVLDKIEDIKSRHSKMMGEHVMDILRVLSSNPHLDIVKKTLGIALDLVTPKNIQEIISLLKKEICKSQSEEFEKGGEYRQILIQSIRNAAIRFPDIAFDVALQLLEFLGDSNPNAALDVVLFVKELIHRYPQMRPQIIASILDSFFDTITSPSVFTPILWLLGEFSDSPTLITKSIHKISSLLVGTFETSKIYGFAHTEGITHGNEQSSQQQAATVSSKPVILADGSYASSSSLVPSSIPSASSSSASSTAAIASLVREGALAAADYFLASCAATALTKLALSTPPQLRAMVLLTLVRFVRMRNAQNPSEGKQGEPVASKSSSGGSNNLNSSASPSTQSSSANQVNLEVAQASIASPLALSSATAGMSLVDPDSQDWFVTCIHILTNKQLNPLFKEIFIQQTKKAFDRTMEIQQQGSGNGEVDESVSADSGNENSNLIGNEDHQQGEPNGNNDQQQQHLQLNGSHYKNKAPTKAMKSSERRQIAEQAGAQQTDSLISFPMLRRGNGMMIVDGDSVNSGGQSHQNEDDIFEDSNSIFNVSSSGSNNNSLAAGGGESKSSIGSSDLNSRLSRVVQLTGLSDSLYVEAVLVVHQYDISLEITIINQTPDTLSNLTLELATLGELKLVERPSNHTVAPNGKLVLTHHVSISSTETGTIFGAIVYDVAGSSSNSLSGNIVVLNEIHIDMIDYIQPAHCDDLTFRTMWQTFEWDTKVSVSAESSLRGFLQHVIDTTNMKCVTPISSDIDKTCGFLAANLYAKSKFGEDALANLSIQRVPGNHERIQGFIRFRAETRGVADSLHAKIIQRMKHYR